MNLTITHTRAEGTLIEGTSKGDGSNITLKANGWRWSRNLGTWYVQQSRDKAPKMYVINPTIKALQATGFTVETEIDDTARPAAQVEADKADRAEARAEALEAKALRKADDAQAAEQASLTASNRLPEGGEPIKIGHHSEGRHRNAISKAHSAMGRSVEADRAATYAANRAETAASTAAHQGVNENPVTTANRIERLKADYRKLERQITADRYDSEKGYIPATEEQVETSRERFTPRLNELQDQINYWEEIRAQQIASGKAANYNKDTVKKGDLVKIRGYWHKVARANAKTVAVETGYTWTDKTPWHEVQNHRTAEEAETASAVS